MLSTMYIMRRTVAQAKSFNVLAFTKIPVTMG
jgi:hypothetical protein